MTHEEAEAYAARLAVEFRRELLKLIERHLVAHLTATISECTPTSKPS
jgi:hypothetical protein